jgi:hypothetical protein
MAIAQLFCTEGPQMKARKTKTQSTLLDLVYSVSLFAKTEAEVVATVAHLVNSGRVQLCGNFAGAKISFDSPLDVFPPQTRPRITTPAPRLGLAT